MNVIKNWYERVFSDAQMVYLIVILIAALAAIILIGDILAPVIAAIVIAFLLDGAVEWLKGKGVRPLLAVIAVFIAFILIALIMFFAILPPIMGQFAQFFGLLPTMFTSLQDQVMNLPKAFPGLINETQIQDVIGQIRAELIQIGQAALAFTLGNFANVLTIIVYVILVPVMVFFFLKDKAAIMIWLRGLAPESRQLATEVWREVMARTGDYARGKVYEILIVGFASWLVYWLLDLQFSAFLALITGLSVIVPYIGAALVTFPVAFVAMFQWGLGSETLIAIAAYLILQALDGNVLVPLLFSEVVKLHPNAIILAVLLFGGIWGLWGVFFAIPLATLANAVLNAWKSHRVPVHDGDAP